MRFTRLLTIICIATCTITAFSHAQRQKLAVGSQGPGMDVAQWLNGEFSQDEAEVYVVEFWATWCPPCLKSIPHLSELQSEFGPDGLTIVGITSEDASVVEPFVARLGSKMDYIVGIDNRGKTHRAWMQAAGRKGIPSAFIVDKSGIIQFIGNPLDPEFDATLAKVMSGRYDQAKEAQAAPLIASARRSSAGQSWQQALNSYQTAIEIDEMVFAELYIEQFKMLLLKKRDANEAYKFASKIIASRGEEDPELLTWLALTISGDPDIESSLRRMDTAVLAVETALKNARRKNDPKYLSAMAKVKFHTGDLDDAIDYQRKAYFSAREEKKDSYKEVLDGYRRQKQRVDASQ
ncbi:MAG: TlpA disulfide reductase family protein [Phycisphaerales bacterium]|nr:TlpA disulfide reductase family protein [Phycisphaerales bacterium]